MAATEPIDIVELGVGDAQAGLVLSTEAGWNQNEADWRFFLEPGNRVRPARRRPAGRNRRAAALLRGQCLDQHGAGDARTGAAAASRPGSSMPASMRRHRRGLTTWLDATPAGATVYGPLGFTPTLQLRRLRLEKPMDTKAARPLSAGDLDALIARDAGAMGFDRSSLLSEFGSRPGSRIVSDADAIALVRDGRTARHIGPLLADRADQALALVDAIVALRDRPLADRRRSLAGRISGRPRPHRAGTSSGRFSACASAPPPPRPRNCRSPSPDRNLDRKRRHAS